MDIEVPLEDSWVPIVLSMDMLINNDPKHIPSDFTTHNQPTGAPNTHRQAPPRLLAQTSMTEKIIPAPF